MSILKVSIRHIKAARSLLGWSQAELAKRAKVSEPTIKRLEAVNDLDAEIGGREETGDRIHAALEKAGIEFLNHGRPGVRLRAQKR